jgi:capsular polysaccharide export protein
MPFYAGWGLTRDELAAPRRRSDVPSITLNDLVHAALVEYPRHIDPETGERCEVERLMQWMTLQRRMRERFPAQVQMVAFSNWKQPIARSFLAGSMLDFVAAPQALSSGAARAVWGRPADDAEVARTNGEPLLRVEDGFLRSVGLGANWVQPLSWVIDSRGMYYDAGAPSDLESLLQDAAFDEAMCARAAALRQAIVAAGITKYNVGSGRWQRPPNARTVVLVPGQVESDLSIAYGAPGMRSNLDLLRRVREDRRDAHLVYKPHPDVLARKRSAGADLDEAHLWCDEVVTDVPIGSLLDAVDEVHVLTSLAGFEALLRGKRVVCHGSPFYAGWGLTEDTQKHPRRTRRLTLDELVAAALILYPTYVSRVSGAFTTPERALYELQHWQQIAPPREAGWLRVMRAVKRMRDRWRRG